MSLPVAAPERTVSRVSVVRQILDLVYPPLCYGCDGTAPSGGFCAPCSSLIRPPEENACHTCGHPFATFGGSAHVCGRCLRKPPAFRSARACTLFGSRDASSPLRTALHRYKYGREVALAPFLSRLLATGNDDRAARHDMIIPVPLHIDRLRWRGFNQALLLARDLARVRAIPIEARVLCRRRATAPQVDLDEHARRSNVAGAFTVACRDRVAGTRILLVDDVLTTGSTVDECSRALRRAGAGAVDVLVLARAVRD